MRLRHESVSCNGPLRSLPDCCGSPSSQQGSANRRASLRCSLASSISSRSASARHRPTPWGRWRRPGPFSACLWRRPTLTHRLTHGCGSASRSTALWLSPARAMRRTGRSCWACSATAQPISMWRAPRPTWQTSGGAGTCLHLTASRSYSIRIITSSSTTARRSRAIPTAWNSRQSTPRGCAT